MITFLRIAILLISFSHLLYLLNLETKLDVLVVARQESSQTSGSSGDVEVSTWLAMIYFDISPLLKNDGPSSHMLFFTITSNNGASARCEVRGVVFGSHAQQLIWICGLSDF